MDSRVRIRGFLPPSLTLLRKSALGFGRSGLGHTLEVSGKFWVNKRKDGPSGDRTGSSLLLEVLAFPSQVSTKYLLPQSNCFLLPWVEGSIQHPQAHVALCCPELILQGQSITLRCHRKGTTFRPLSHSQLIHKGCSISEGGLFLLLAQVYNDISHGGVFEDGCLERNHVFPSIHDAVLFAQANAREVAPGHDFQGVRSRHLGNPRPQGIEIAEPGALERTQKFWVPNQS